MNKIIVFLLCLSASCYITSCKTIESSDVYLLNDDDMQIEQRWTKSYDEDFYHYREGSSGAWGTNNGGGGCGCN